LEGVILGSEEKYATGEPEPGKIKWHNALGKQIQRPKGKEKWKVALKATKEKGGGAGGLRPQALGANVLEKDYGAGLKGVAKESRAGKRGQEEEKTVGQKKTKTAFQCGGEHTAGTALKSKRGRAGARTW